MTQVPDYVPLLVAGATSEPREGGCLVQIANWLVDPTTWTDDDLHVDPVLCAWGIIVNDGIGEQMRRRLALCAPRIAGTKLDPDTEELVHFSLKYWIEKGAGSGLPFYLHPAGSTMNLNTNPPTLTVHAPVKTLTGGEEYAVQWYEALVAEFERLTARDVQELPVKKWLELKELIGQ